MECLNDKKLLDYVNNELNIPLKKEFEKHLEKCENCQTRLSEWKKALEITERFVEMDKKAIKVPEFSESFITQKKVVRRI